MRALIRLFAATTALALSTGVAFAVMGKTRTDVALQTAPAAQGAAILNLPAHARVSVGHGGRGCCGRPGTNLAAMSAGACFSCRESPPAASRQIPVHPPYPYRAGHYATAGSYYDPPPYADINPAVYSRRNFMLAQERNRYRYVPYIFNRSEAQRYQ